LNALVTRAVAPADLAERRRGDRRASDRRTSTHDRRMLFTAANGELERRTGTADRRMLDRRIAQERRGRALSSIPRHDALSSFLPQRPPLLGRHVDVRV
jgi:hypothetical protein